MVDYSRFDHIGSSDSEDDEKSTRTSSVAVNVPTSSAATPTISVSSPPPGAAMQQRSPADHELDKTQKLPQQQQEQQQEQQEQQQKEQQQQQQQQQHQAPGGGGGSSFPQPMMMTASKKGKEGRIKFEHEGRTVYEWEQSLEEVNLYIETPTGLRADNIDCKITPKHLRLGIKGNPPFIDEDTGGPVVVEESYWMMDGGELNVNLQKMKKADTWPGALWGKNTSVDPVTLEGMQKKIMLERFQAENPGFDFSGADFNGQVPDARSFMGGVKYT